MLNIKNLTHVFPILILNLHFPLRHILRMIDLILPMLPLIIHLTFVFVCLSFSQKL